MPLLSLSQMTERDLAILRELFHCRVMTLAQLAGLQFDGRQKAAAKRVRKLKRRGLISERPRLPQQPSILFITKKGFTTVKQEGGLSDYPDSGWELLKKRVQVSPLTLQHELDVMTVRVALEKAVRSSERFTVAEFSTWPRLFQFRCRSAKSGQMMWMRPDAFARIHEKESDGGLSEHLFYAEIDRSSEVLDVLTRKASGYLEHFQTGGLAARLGGSREQFKEFPFRVLWVFRTSERRNNAAEAFLTHRPPVLTQAWMTTMKDLLADPLGRIWVRPIDYRDAVKGSPFDPSVTTRRSDYRRQTNREVLVEHAIRRHALLGDVPTDTH